jgi:hypothetical protein
MTTEIRQATEMVAAGTQSITFLEYVQYDDTAPSQVRFFLNGENLMRGEIPPTGTGPTYTYDPADEITSTLSFRVVNGATDIFSYFDQNGAQLFAPIGLPSVTLVGIHLSFEQLDNPKTFDVSTKVQLRFNKNNL